MKHKSGFSVIELLTAMSISIMVVATVTYLLYGFFAEQRNLDVWSGGQFEMSLALNNIEGDVRNVIRLDPTENLTSAGADEYFGLTSIPVGMEPPVCANDATGSVIRYTTLDRKQRPERVLRAWSEVVDVNETGPSHELRLSADNSDASMFGDSRSPKELVLVDADRRYIRRYKVSSHLMNLGGNLDPYDDLPKNDSFGNPIIYNFARVSLRSPSTVDSSPIPIKTSVFITGTEAYSSSTYYVCLRRSDRSLIKFDENTGADTVLLKNPSVDFTVGSFNIGYLATKPGLRVEPPNFVTDMLTATNRTCFNTVLLDLKLNASAAYLDRNKDQAVGEIKTDIKRQRTVFSQNLNMKRPLMCTN